MALLVILVFAAALRIYMFRGWVGLDDAEYARFAALFAEGRPFPSDYSGPAVFPLRVGVFVPAGLLFRWFGVNEWAMVLYPLAVSLTSIVLIYASAALFFGWRAGLMAAALLSAYHWDLDSATKLLPDLPAAFFATTGIMLIVALERHVSRTWSRAFAGGLLAGLAFGLAWLCKESLAYLAPFMFTLLAITVWRGGPRMWLVWAGVAVGSASVLAGEMIAYQAATGDFLFRFHEVERNYRQWPNGFFTSGSDFGWKEGTTRSAALMDRLFVSGPRTILFDPSLYYVPFIGLAATAYAWVRRDRAFLVPGLWLWALVVMFNFGSSSSTEYIPLALFHRYMYLMFFPAIVVVAGFLARTLAPVLHLDIRPRTLVAAGGGLAAVVLMLWAAAPHLYYDVTNPRNWTDEVKKLRATVRPDVSVYADGITLRAFEFFAGYPERTAWTDFANIDSSKDIPPGSLVVVNKQYIAWLNRNAGMWVAFPPGPTDRSGYRMHTFYDQAPSNWTEIWKNDNARLYKVAGAVPAR
ncbi:MAG: hypothetical protein A3H95_05865 [Acidobacteria bacterium RIFCSPLOWO2_02_FULL_64_15]|nr:MAG: hypothetical protein A3H95_05865 [Acidobacteria bacterium RIFCSPLOWO2_02_FULL_64_15]